MYDPSLYTSLKNSRVFFAKQNSNTHINIQTNNVAVNKIQEKKE